MSLRSTHIILYVFLFVREEMPKDCVVRIAKLKPPYGGDRQQITSKTESASINFGSTGDSRAVARDRLETLQIQSETDAPNAKDLQMTDEDVIGTDYVSSPMSDEGNLVIIDEIYDTPFKSEVSIAVPSQSSRDNASNYEVDIDSSAQSLHDIASNFEVYSDSSAHSSHDSVSNYEVVDIDVSSESSRGSEDTVEKTGKKEAVEAAPDMRRSCEGTSALLAVKTNSQYQPVIRLKRLDPAELKRWTSARKSQSRVQDEGRKRKYVICVLYDELINILI